MVVDTPNVQHGISVCSNLISYWHCGSMHGGGRVLLYCRRTQGYRSLDAFAFSYRMCVGTYMGYSDSGVFDLGRMTIFPHITTSFLHIFLREYMQSGLQAVDIFGSEIPQTRINTGFFRKK